MPVDFQKHGQVSFHIGRALMIVKQHHRADSCLQFVISYCHSVTMTINNKVLTDTRYMSIGRVCTERAPSNRYIAFILYNGPPESRDLSQTIHGTQHSGKIRRPFKL